jgi:hypothetical protein
VTQLWLDFNCFIYKEKKNYKKTKYSLSHSNGGLETVGNPKP